MIKSIKWGIILGVVCSIMCFAFIASPTNIKNLQQVMEIVHIDAADGSKGTGFWINDRNIVTNKHVVQDSFMNLIILKNNRGEFFPGVIKYVDDTLDVAVVEAIDPKYHTRSATLTCNRPIFGDSAHVIGDMEYVENQIMPMTVTGNTINIKMDGSNNIMETWGNHRIFLTGLNQMGSSGSPVYNRMGNVIGINSGYFQTLPKKSQPIPSHLGVVTAVGSKDLCDILKKENIKFKQSQLDFINREEILKWVTQ